MLQSSLTNEQRSRLYWQCRRGMLELDALLQDFFKRDFDTLDDREVKAFTRLLEYPDNLLLEYLMGRTAPLDRALADVVTKIRRTAAD